MIPSDENKAIGRRIKQLAKDHGYKIAKIAMDTHLSESTVSRMNRGYSLSKENISIIAEYYGVSTDFILTGAEKANEEPTREFMIRTFIDLDTEDMKRLYDIAKLAKIV